MNRGRSRTAALALLAAGAVSALAQDVEFARPGGGTLKLSDYRGKQAVVLLFMRGSAGEFACFHCGRQTHDYRANYEKFRAAGAEVLLVLPGPANAAGYLRKVGELDEAHPEPDFSVPFPVVADPDFAACRAFNVPVDESPNATFPVSRPATVVLDKDGKVLFEHHGKNPSDRPAVDKVLAVLTGVAPAAGAAAASAAPSGKHPTLAWVEFEAGMRQARERRLPILLDFYADW
ncbi:MAG: redoxin domain-containing protein [Planctomycetes bacterium]|nr:redoxin domain-containing protein [Planctomycetota bacterium]